MVLSRVLTTARHQQQQRTTSIPAHPGSGVLSRRAGQGWARRSPSSPLPWCLRQARFPSRRRTSAAGAQLTASTFRLTDSWNASGAWVDVISGARPKGDYGKSGKRETRGLHDADDSGWILLQQATWPLGLLRRLPALESWGNLIVSSPATGHQCRERRAPACPVQGARQARSAPQKGLLGRLARI